MQITRKILEPEWQVDGDNASAALPTKIQFGVSSIDGVQFDWNVSTDEGIGMSSGTAKSMTEAQAAAWRAHLDLLSQRFTFFEALHPSNLHNFKPD